MRRATLPSPARLWKSEAVVCKLAIIGAVVFAGCAKSPTDVLTTVSADATVPPLLILRVTVSGAPGQTRGLLQSSTVGDASDRPGPFAFPLLLPASADPSFVGPVTITVDGLDWDTQALLATGSTPAEVVAGHETQAALTLTAASGAGGGDGSAPDGSAEGD
jgi:hypothetical protein